MTTWGVYSIQGRTSSNSTVPENDKTASRWFVRWRVNGELKKRTFPTKGYARTFRDQLLRAQLMGWDADDRGWPLDPSAASTASMAGSTQSDEEPPGQASGMTFAEYCEGVWWPIVGPTFGDKNKLGHRSNMRTAIELLVYRDGDRRCGGDGPRPGDSIRLAHLVPDDLRLALVVRRSINRRTATANDRRLTAALQRGETDLWLPPEEASPATVRAFYVTLSMIIKAAARSGHTTGDPLDGVASLAPKVRPTSLTGRLVPSIDEVFDLADAIAQLGPNDGGRPRGERYRSLVLAAGTLGPRPGELVRHQPDWISFGSPSVVTFMETESAVYDTETGLRGRRSRPLKHRAAGEKRSVPALDDVADALRLHLERGYHSAERTWTSPTGRAALDWGNIMAVYWRPACDKVFGGTTKTELATMPPKTLRRAAITYWLNCGISPYLAAEWAGHDVEIARTYYAGRAASTYSAEVDLLTAPRQRRTAD